MSTDAIIRTNELLQVTSGFRKLLENKDLPKLLSKTVVDWRHGKLIEAPAPIKQALRELGFFQEDGGLRLKGLSLLGKLVLDLDRSLKAGAKIAGRYVLEDRLATGKNSIAYKAVDNRLGRTVVLKFFRPGRGEGIIKGIAKLGDVQSPYLVLPLDLLVHPVSDLRGKPVDINVLVYPFVSGMTLSSYLQIERNATPFTIHAFIEQTAMALAALEKKGLWHGDFHPNNVLITSDEGDRVSFRIIDVSYGADKPSNFEAPNDDFTGFKFVLSLALEVFQSGLGNLSVRKALGSQIYTLVDRILAAEKLSFDEILLDLRNRVSHGAYLVRKKAFLADKFKVPGDFGLLRYEEITDPKVALSLFCQFEELFSGLKDFGSSVLFGHRGTGKSTYLAALTFFPEVEEPVVDFREIFGILFSCRQGEFRKFTGRHFQLNAAIKLRIRDIFILKIVRKTLSALAQGVARARLKAPLSVNRVAATLLPKLQQAPGLISVHQYSEIDSLHATVLRAESNAIDELFAHKNTGPQSRLFDEQSLVAFFEAVRLEFSELANARFYVMFDDAGVPNVPGEVQSIICDLIASTNSVFCVKLSAEKTTFKFETSEKKPVERTHDVKHFNISDFLNLGNRATSDRFVVEQYFRKLVGHRLKVFKYASDDIRHYLGDQIVSIDEIVAALASGKKPTYCGWSVAWQVADRTTRHLLEMINAMFSAVKLHPSAEPAVISESVQNKQIVRCSEDKLRSLLYIPGTIEVHGKRTPIGKLLFDFATSYGVIAQYFLCRNAPTKAADGSPRYDERLAIEIDDDLDLTPDVERVLNQLLRFAVIDDDRMVKAFDDGRKKPLYVFNRIYCPALRISFRRQRNWRLGSARFTSFLREPAEFVQSDTRLRNLLETDKAKDDELF